MTSKFPRSLLTESDRQALAPVRNLGSSIRIQHLLAGFFMDRLHLVFADISDEDAYLETFEDIWAQLTDEDPESDSPAAKALDAALESALGNAIGYAFESKTVQMIPPGAPEEPRQPRLDG